MKIDLMHDYDQVLAECLEAMARLASSKDGIRRLDKMLNTMEAIALRTGDPVHLAIAAMACLGMIVTVQAFSPDNPGAPAGGE